MSRLIVRNLPDKITKEKLYEIFSEKGTITDVQLKYTKTGKFRKFAFIGYQKQEEADSALESLNKTFINTSRIQIEHCKALADPDKSRSWSKHAPDSSANKKKRDEVKEGDEDSKKKKKEPQKKIKDPKLEKLLFEYKDDVMFKEFVQTQVKDDRILQELNEITSDEKGEEEVKVADRPVSDLEYLKLKTGLEDVNIGKDEQIIESSKKLRKAKNIKLYTVKIRGLPVKFKKREIKEFLNVSPFTIRRACGMRNIIFVGFKTEGEMKKALFKNRSFFSGKRIYVREVKSSENTSESKPDKKWEEQEKKLKDEETVAESGRIYVRNLPYVVNEDEVKALFEKYGPVSEIVLPVDSFTRKLKGFCIVTFVMPEHAAKAFNELDGTIFQGRMLHLLPGIDNKKKDEENDESITNYKLKKLLKDKKNAGSSTNWNTFFVSENALAAAIADTYNTTKEQVLDDNKNAAVRLALGETQIVNKMKEFLEENDVCLDSLNDIRNRKRSKKVILVKNLPFGTKLEELVKKFSEFGELQRVVLPPNGITGIVEFIEPSEAKKAFMKTAYSKFKNVPLYLEWAPEEIFKSEGTQESVLKKGANEDEITGKNAKDKEPEGETHAKPSLGDDYICIESSPVEGTVIFVKNLNFSTEENALQEHFSKCGRILSVTIARKKDPKQPKKSLSLGYGFVHFSSKEEADNALKTLQFSKLEGHILELKRSHRTTKPEQNFRHFAANTSKPSTKILVRNVPFQAVEKEIYDLFKVFGEIKSVRLPKKMVGTGSHRGFCFVEYITVHEAKRAFKALSQSTHLYGRRLVLEWAATDDDDVEKLRTKTAERFKSGKKGKKSISMEEVEKADSDSRYLLAEEAARKELEEAGAGQVDVEDQGGFHLGGHTTWKWLIGPAHDDVFHLKRCGHYFATHPFAEVVNSRMRVCADCGKTGPTWASLNHGILLCDECCSIHRNIGRHVSWVRPLQQISSIPSLRMMVETLNKAGANNIWEHTLLELPTSTLSCKPSSNNPLHGSTKEEFIRKKYEELKFILKTDQESEGPEGVSAQLHASARTSDLLTSLRLFAQGADPNYYHEEKGNTPLHVAAKSGQLLQVELLVIHGANIAAKDSLGKTPEECAIEAKHMAVAERLREIKHQVRDRLINYLNCKKPAKLDHFDIFRGDVQNNADFNDAKIKLEMLSNTQFEKLVADVYDEVDRREAEGALLSSNSSKEVALGNSAPFLPVHPELSSTRNQGRQKLACLTNKELNTLIIDILQESKRRNTTFPTKSDELKKTTSESNPYSQLLLSKIKSEISDEEPLYDSVASDEDYAYTEKTSGEDVSAGTVHNGTPNITVDGKNMDEGDLRKSLASSLSTINRLQSEIRLLQDTVAGLIKENRELKDEILQVKSFARGIEASSEGEAEPVSDSRSQRMARPNSMYETREGLRYWNGKNDETRNVTQSLYQRQPYVQDQPRYEDVIRRTEQVAKRVKELWTAVVECDFRTFVPCAERIRVAVAELIAIFPQSPPDDLIRELGASTTRLQMECGSLQNCSSSLVSERLQQIRNCAYDIAKATKLLIMKSEGC